MDGAVFMASRKLPLWRNESRVGLPKVKQPGSTVRRSGLQPAYHLLLMEQLVKAILLRIHGRVCNQVLFRAMGQAFVFKWLRYSFGLHPDHAAPLL